MKYKIILNQSEEGYSVSCPNLPGCWSQGDTEQEAIENIKDAIQEYLAPISELLETLARHFRSNKPTDFKTTLEISS